MEYFPNRYVCSNVVNARCWNARIMNRKFLRVIIMREIVVSTARLLYVLPYNSIHRNGHSIIICGMKVKTPLYLHSSSYPSIICSLSKFYTTIVERDWFENPSGKWYRSATDCATCSVSFLRSQINGMAFNGKRTSIRSVCMWIQFSFL